MAQGSDKTFLRRRKLHGGWLARKDRRRKDWEWNRTWLPSRREYEREDVLIEFLGEERAPSVMASLRPPLQNAGQVASSLFGKLDLKSNTILDEIVKNWIYIVGPDNAKECRPQGVEKGALSIEVFSPSWMFALNCNKPLITRRVFEITSGAVKRVYLVPQGASRKKLGEIK